MACGYWGDGSKWGDGKLWCRQFETQRYINDPTESRAFHRVALEVEITNNTGMVIDRLSTLLNEAVDQNYTHEAFTDYTMLSRVAVEINVTTNAAFVINSIIPYVQLKPHDPIG